MNRYLLDTGIMSDFINRRTGVEASATRDANLAKLERTLT